MNPSGFRVGSRRAVPKLSEVSIRTDTHTLCSHPQRQALPWWVKPSTSTQPTAVSKHAFYFIQDFVLYISLDPPLSSMPKPLGLISQDIYVLLAALPQLLHYTGSAVASWGYVGQHPADQPYSSMFCLLLCHTSHSRPRFQGDRLPHLSWHSDDCLYSFAHFSCHICALRPPCDSGHLILPT